MGRSTMVLGGTRSGKSGYAEALIGADTEAVYLATALRDPADTDWQARIERHRRRRPARWRTVEPASADELATLIAATVDHPVLVDDLATWLTRSIDEACGWDGEPTALAAIDQRSRSLVHTIAQHHGQMVLVSAEVGLGIVPETRSGRLFRDQLGTLNADLGQVCDRVSLVVAGIELRLK